MTAEAHAIPLKAAPPLRAVPRMTPPTSNTTLSALVKRYEQRSEAIEKEVSAYVHDALWHHDWRERAYLNTTREMEEGLAGAYQWTVGALREGLQATREDVESIARHLIGQNLVTNVIVAGVRGTHLDVGNEQAMQPIKRLAKTYGVERDRLYGSLANAATLDFP